MDMDLIPHGVCLSSEPWLVGGLVMANTLIFLAYMGIPFVLIMVIRWQRLNPLTQNTLYFPLAAWFAAFIMGCGLTHAMAVWTMYVGGAVYYLEVVVCVATAMVSLTTLFLMWGVLRAFIRESP